MIRTGADLLRKRGAADPRKVGLPATVACTACGGQLKFEHAILVNSRAYHPDHAPRRQS